LEGHYSEVPFSEFDPSSFVGIQEVEDCHDGFSFNCRPHYQDIKEAQGLRQLPCCGREDLNLSHYYNRSMMV
jgi:hypothetical protein